MSVKIRLRRTGALSAACWRIVVADARSPRDGRFIENIGVYDPRHDSEKMDVARMEYWISKGAQPSEPVMAIYNRQKNGKPFPARREPVKNAAPAPRALKVVEEAPAADAEAPAAE
ncbi:MAG: 30S ribosomal protein S16 [Lentisphaeria bacterium]|nr:30S ribosomal protein S16 [Lentisphaeria bacterium]